MMFKEYNLLWDNICTSLRNIPEIDYLYNILDNFEIIDIKYNTITIFTNFHNIYSLMDEKKVNIINNVILKTLDKTDFRVIFQSNFIKNISIDKNKTLECFKITSENRLAVAVANEVCSYNSTKLYSPVFLFAETGMGKTHLINGIIYKYSQIFPHKKINYYSGETFINSFFEAVKRNLLNEWKNNNLTCELFLIDDLHLLENNENIINEFYSLFEALYSAHNKPQIIITSNKKAAELQGFPESLKSRLQWGVKIEIQSPNKSAKENIIASIFAKYNISIDIKIVSYLAKNYNGNIRELEGIIKTIFTYSTLLNENINIELIDNILGKNKVQDIHSITGDDILFNVCKYFNIKEQDIKSKNRTRAIAFPRQIGMYITKYLTNISLQEIGKIYGGRDHSTVKHSNDKIKALYNNDINIKNTINKLIKQINNQEVFR